MTDGRDELVERKTRSGGTRPLPTPGKTYVPWELMKPGWTAQHPQRKDNWDVERDAMVWLMTGSIEETTAMYEKWIRRDDHPKQPTWWERVKASFRAWEYGKCHHGVNTFIDACTTCTQQYEECVTYLRLLKSRALAFYRSRDFWLGLDGFEFERQVGKLFEQLGKSAQVTSGTGDWGVDIFIRDASGVTAVQCKTHRDAIGPSVIRDLYGAMVHFRTNRGMVISTGGYTAGAIAFAKDKPIDLLDLGDLLRLQMQTIAKLS